MGVHRTWIVLSIAGAIASGFGSFAATLPAHEGLRVLIVSDEVNPHGLPPASLTQPGEIGAALLAPGSGLVLDTGPDPVREIPTNQIETATALLSLPLVDPGAYDVLIYFAHRIPNNGMNDAARQAAFTAAVEAYLEAGGGVVSFHHGSYLTAGKEAILDLIGGTASGAVAWNTMSGQNVINVAPAHFVTCYGMAYGGSITYADATRGIPSGSYPFFNNTPDERYLTFGLNPGAEVLEVLFGSDYVQNGSTHLLGFTHRQADWRGIVVAYQPGEYQPNALDVNGPNFQILANAILYAGGLVPRDGIALSVERGPAADEVTLSWEACAGSVSVYRSIAPDDVANAVNLLGSTSAASWTDAPPPDGVAYYLVVR